MSDRDPSLSGRWPGAVAFLLLVVAGLFGLLRVDDADRSGPDDGTTTARRADPARAGGRVGIEPRETRRSDRETLRYDDEYPSIPYSTAQPSDRVARLQARLARGEVELEFDPVRGYLDSLLAALEIDPASQVLVFSQTSLQGRRIRPETPRAIYFDDDVYVAWVQNGPIEIASIDPHLGAVFYLLEQDGAAAPTLDRELTRCLGCHDSYSLSGGGVPRLIVGSGYTGRGGELVSHEGWILVTDRTPLASRWGGWYVTGRHGDQVHLGNIVIRDLRDFERFEELRVGNVDTLDALFDTRPYLTSKSDIVALLVLEHQTTVQNLVTRVLYDAKTILDAETGAPSAVTLAKIEEIVEPLVEALFFLGEAKLASPIAGDEAFARQFAARAIRDERGRSLRDLDMRNRMFRYPLSYLVHSASVDALPDSVKTTLFRRIGEILRGEDTRGKFSHLSARDRQTIAEIIATTKPEVLAGRP